MPTGLGIESYEGSEGYIFISYAPEDENRIMPLVHEMYRRGHRICFDDGMLGSDAKCRMIDNAAVAVLFVTPKAVGSERIEKEMNIAAENRLPVIPVYFGVDAQQQQLDPAWKIKRGNVINGGKGTNFMIDEVERKMLGCARQYTKDTAVKKTVTKKRRRHSVPILIGVGMVIISAAFAVTMMLMSLDWSKILPKSELAGEQQGVTAISLSEVSIGDIVSMGKMEIDGDTENGDEDIQWKIVDIQNNKALLVSVNSLCYMAYHNRKADITWQDCTLRQYLNETFYRKAFSEKERYSIVLAYNNNDRNQRTDVSGGEKTNDYIFCLSLNEVEQYFPNAEDRCCMPTMAAMIETYGKKTASIGDMWWTRSPGKSRGNAGYVKSLGSIDYFGYQVSIENIGVRPAMWVEVKK